MLTDLIAPSGSPVPEAGKLQVCSLWTSAWKQNHSGNNEVREIWDQ